MKQLLNKTYSGESIVDVERDVYEALADDSIPQDEYGFAKGQYRVVITFEEDDETTESNSKV